MENDEIVNAALEMSLEWGPNWLQPINARLREKYPQLTEKEAESLNVWCAAVRTFAFDLVEKEYKDEQAGKGIGSEAVQQEIRQKYPQVNAENLSHLYSQGMYYAWHG